MKFKEFWENRHQYEAHTKNIPLLVRRKIHEIPRRKSLLHFIESLPKNQQHLHILEVGCGRGRWCKLMQQMGFKTYGIDFSENAIRWAKDHNPEIPFKQMPATKLSFPNQFFDAVVSISVLQCIPYKKQFDAIREMKRVTKKYIYLQELNNTNIKAPHVFPRSTSEWVSLFKPWRCIRSENLQNDLVGLIFEKS